MQPDDASAAVLERYLPTVLLHRLATGSGRSPGRRTAVLEVAALWVDISGFTPLTGALARQGVRGAELVTGILNRCFGELIERVSDAGGDVVDFGGDGLLAIWPATGTDDLQNAVLRATRCALGIQRDLDHFPATADAALRFYAAVGAGCVHLMELGGVDDRWRFVVAGEAVGQMARAGSRWKVGETVLSPEALAALPGAVVREARGRGFGVVTSAGPEDPVDAVAHAQPCTVDPADADRMRPWVVDTVLQRVDAGQTDWLAEFRTASVLFVVVPEPDVESEAGRQALGAMVRAAQDRARALEGSINQVIMDDNGFVVLMAWGVPGHAHEDDARRALQAAVDIREEVTGLGLEPRVGVASGELFCGSYGNDRRQRYGLVGAVVNRAARIAMASRDGVLCDERTRDGGAAYLELVDMGPTPLKGIDEPVRIFHPTGARSGPRARMETVGSHIAGREGEREILSRAVARAAEGEDPPLVLLEGEPGIGKSVLLGHLIELAGAAGLSPLVGSADAVERSTSFYPWREPFRTLLNVDSDPDPEEARTRVSAVVDGLPGHEGRAPLLEPLLRIELVDNEMTAAMAGVDRGVATRALLVDLVDRLGGRTPVFVLDDLHWFDSASLALIAAIRARVPRALIAAATRPAEGEAAAALAEIAEGEGTVRVPLAEMNESEVLDMVRRSLSVESVPDTLADLLVRRGEGHPLFTVEVALLLRDIGALGVEDGRCLFDPNDSRLSALRLSDRAQGVVATRIDRLDPTKQLALKVASVIGRSFVFRLVQAIHPIEHDRPRLRRVLDELIEPRLLELERPDPVLAYMFRHVVIREVAYGLVAFAQRRRLHADVARALELSEEGDQPGTFPLLAHHWSMAEEFGPAIEYLIRSGEEALRRGAGREAFRFFKEAFDLSEEHRSELPGVTEVHLAALERRMGDAVEQLHDVQGSALYLRRALERLGHTVHGPDSPGRRGALAMQIAVQVGHIVWPRWLRRRRASEDVQALELAARAYGTHSQHCYFQSDMLGMLLSSLMSVNLAERAGTLSAADSAYVSLAHVVGLMGIEPLVRRYRTRSAHTTLGRTVAFRDIELAGRLLARGRSEEAAEAGERAARQARRYADRHGEAQGWGCVAMSMLQLGRTDATAEAADRMLPTGQAEWAMSAQCAAHIYAGRPEGALERFASLEKVEPAFEFGHLVAGMLWAEQQGDGERAEEWADRTLAFARAPGIKNAFISVHYADLLAFYSRLYARLGEDDPGRLRGVMERVAQLHLELQAFSRIFRIGRPILERAALVLAARRGRKGKAERHLARGLRLAERMALRPETVMLHVEAARSGLQDGLGHLRRAAALCRRHRLDRLLLEVEETERLV